MIQWIKDAYNDLIAWFKAFFQAAMDFLTDLPVTILENILDALAGLLESIPVPDFVANGMQSMLSGIDPSILYFLDRSGLSPALAVLGSGLAFRLLRKLFTLGQW